MRIGFIAANRERFPDPVIPLGLLSVVAATPAHHDTWVWDLCFEDDPLGFLAQRVLETRPDLFALSLRNLQNRHYSGIEENLAWYSDLVAALRCLSDAPVVVGGAGFSVMPDAVLRRIGADFGVVGEGEVAFQTFLAELEGGANRWDSVPNLVRRVPGGVVRSPTVAAFPCLDDLPSASRAHVDPRHYQHVGTDSVQTKRGCPFSCRYCTYPQIEGRVSRLRSPSRVVDELCEAVALQPDLRHVFVVDSTFNHPRRHALAVCRELAIRDWAVPWTCYINPKGFDRELADAMVAAGCQGMEVGTDSGCPAVLERQGKGFTLAEVRALRSVSAAAGLRDCHTFVLGTEGETVDEVRESLDFLEDLEPYAAILMLYIDEREALDPVLARAQQAFRALLGEEVRARCAQQPTWIVPQLGIGVDDRLLRLLRRQGLDGPLWQYVDRRDATPLPARPRSPLAPRPDRTRSTGT